MIKWDESYDKVCEDMSPGTTERLNHKNCSAGEDTRRRLYLSRPATGHHILAYCHNCQEGGAFKASEGYRPTFRGSDEGLSVDKEIIEWSDPSLTTTQDDWPADMLSLFWRHGLDRKTIAEGKIAYEPDRHAAYFPMYEKVLIWNEGSDSIVEGYKGYQLRNLKGPGPKYTTAMKNPDASMSSLLVGVSDKNPIVGVVVEDYLSALRLIQAHQPSWGQLQVLVNYGTKVDPQVLSKLKRCDYIKVWLDNDNDHVRGQAEKMERTLSLITKAKVTTIEDYDDPKRQSYDTIRECLWTV